MLLFTLIFSLIVKMPSEGAPYAAFVYTALLPWTYFSTALSNGAKVDANNADMLKAAGAIAKKARDAGKFPCTLAITGEAARRSRDLGFQLIALGSDAVAIFLFLGDPRMRVPMDGLLIILAADFARQLSERIRARTRRELVLAPAPDPNSVRPTEPEHAP